MITRPSLLKDSNKFHFIEIDWIIYFPFTGNEGRKYPKYGVAFLNRKTGVTQPGVRVNLEDVLNKPSIKQNYPHTVSHYVEASGRGSSFRPSYTETRIIGNLEDFSKFLGDLSI